MFFLASETIRLEILNEIWFDILIHGLTALNDDIFLVCGKSIKDSKVIVYDRNRAAVQEIVALSDKHPLAVEACSVSKCIYVLCVDEYLKCASVLRLTKDGERHQFSISLWVSGLRLPLASTIVSRNGRLSVTHGLDPVIIDVYSANGSLTLSVTVAGFRPIHRVIQKPDGNLVLGTLHGSRGERILTELGADGKIQRQCKSSLGMANVNEADEHGRIVLCKSFAEMELLDSEFNVLEFAGNQKNESWLFNAVSYNGERNEVMGSYLFVDGKSLLTIFRFTEA